MRRGVVAVAVVIAALVAGAPTASGSQFSNPTAIKMPDGGNFLPTRR